AGLCAAFPPAPYYTIYGIVRDQVGQTVTAEGASVILLKGGEEIARTAIDGNSRLDQNYELAIRLDQNRFGTALYSERAVEAQGLFSLAVDLNGALFYPIEVSGSLTAGMGGERVRLDLNLGEDSDLDGLPDVWEEWQLYQAGHYPDEFGNWAIDLLSKNGDFDRDGQSDWMEYVAGTFAGDATERFKLDIKEKNATHVRFEFYAIIGKTYTIERTTDLRTWSRIPFSIGAAESGSNTYVASEVGIVTAFTEVSTSGNEQFRLTVR
ncbi:MAG: hypothetical protein AAGA58_16585, partial [Verrucomicrobiota bacterium]